MKNNLEERLIAYAASVIEAVQALPEKKAASHLGGQLLRSGTAAALNYGEAQAGESRRDFVHKMKVILKELRESSICLRLLLRTEQFSEPDKIASVMDETNQLIAIFVKSVQTAEKNGVKKE